MVGLSVANALLRTGHLVTSVFPAPEQARPVASRAAGAMLGAFGELGQSDGDIDDPGFRFRLRAQQEYAGWLEDICERSGKSVRLEQGTFVIANNVGGSDRACVRKMKEYADALGETAEFVEPEDVPGLKANRLYGPGLCLYLPGEHAINPDDLLAALAASAATFDTWDHRCDLIDQANPDGEGWRLTTQSGEGLVADAVVLCAGSRSWDMLSHEIRHEAALPDMYFGKGVSCIVRGGPVVPSTIRTPNRAFACGIHVVPRADGLLYLGATNNLGVDHEAEVGVQPGELHNLFDEVIHQINTDVREARIESVQVGFRPIVAHGKPIIGRSALPGLFVGTGTYRDGVLMAPMVGKVIAGEFGGSDEVTNPFPVDCGRTKRDFDSLISAGIRDQVAFLQEPRGELPYDRADQLQKYLETLFSMAIEPDGKFAGLRKEIQHRLEDAPLTETMNKIFYDVIAHAEQRRGEQSLT